MSSQIYFSEIMHQRKRPFTYRFRYPALHLKVDIDRIDDEADALKSLSLNHFGRISLYTKDFGARNPEVSWRDWINGMLERYGHSEPPARVALVCAPRMFGIVFNPLAAWYAYDAQGQLIAIIAEVSNTFGQFHHYVLSDQGQPLLGKNQNTLQAEADKAFHVSPFLGMQCRYRFRFALPGDTYRLGIYQSENGQSTLVATQVSKARPLTDAMLQQASRRFPLDSLRTLWRIHWWALKIWLKGGRFHKTPKSLIHIAYSHSAMRPLFHSDSPTHPQGDAYVDQTPHHAH
ncbi:MAG: DUF1365 domain-containing protein [Hydrogenovibrio sp.]|uniref:DUF1365 domain-containing protein n=1 Tax=Hydrogenovibrio sp. TaxID=2065821 RepID=UPI00286FF833|nr:DUF1365 domain-containing protein [Hydrogenovibrio sp.]MDR9498799.1 DUF1365 domain-containing protein [Hydrogenovibrio sp.]